MGTSFPGTFRLRQTLADLNRQKLLFPLATVRRLGAGMGMRPSGSPDLQRRLEWFFDGKVPPTELVRDPLVHAALLMASALPEEDFDAFVAATVLLLVERLSVRGGKDDGFWNWRRLSSHYRLADPALRAAIMCGFREAGRLSRISLGAGPSDEDCLTTPKDEVLDAFGQNRVDFPLLAAVHGAVRDEVDPRDAGDLWFTQHRSVALLPEAARKAALSGFRYLHERPLAMEPPQGADVPVIPAID